ncbi:RiPP maturation radical SAM C-methyltransferase [Mechercharimyces sp. CAU 1602]|uniref:RiPP maturation radical SAM C-methyltransferase n=1 Tax=Mechercharimyces sp. CAU 1602 TaxID=2973933 RepID=UPI0021634708|nr:RiPP maturation radical SAM C-methyltransferase [Mechercharimyces sp. CAU 1602]MCS1351059.1 RiPP maturation radical SAM C-methyltransferase [Mechercharimyces sp. CAU 1602]
MQIALVNMPFGSLDRPPIGISLLKSQVELQGHSCKNLFLNLKLVDYIGVATFNHISNTIPSLLIGEWLFSSSLFPNKQKEEEYLKLIPERLGYRTPIYSSENLLQIKQKISIYLDDCIDDYPWIDFDLIGFTSVFEQNAASLALAKRIKERWPQKKVIIGGANCEGPMGVAMIKAFPFLDFICQGEGDLSFPILVDRIASNGSTDDIPGILTPVNTDKPSPHKANMVTNLDQLPYPDYTDYFEQFCDAGLSALLKPVIPFETSRGCWWGEKSHCTFCGLNGLNMRFRSKNSERAIQEIETLRNKYHEHTTSMAAVDNIIDYKYFQDFIPKLIELDLGVDLFYETKANIKREQLDLIKKAGFTSIQPGIESLITDVLKRMRKGITMLQNVRLLKWCEEFGITPAWNILFGFPGENPADYQHIGKEMIPKLVHFHPPLACASFRLDRFSPYFDYSAQHGIINVKYNRVYKYIYSELTDAEREKLAYYFEFEYDDQRQPSSYTQMLQKAVYSWKEKYDSCFFCFVKIPNGIRFFDNRTNADGDIYDLYGWEAELYQSVDDIKTASGVHPMFQSAKKTITVEQIEAKLDEFVAKGWALHEGGRYLALAIPEGIYSLPDEMLDLLQEHGSSPR